MQVTAQRSFLEFLLLVGLAIPLFKYLIVAAATIVAFPIMMVIGLLSNSVGTMPWNVMVPAWLVAGGYIALWQWRRLGRFAPLWLQDFLGRALDRTMEGSEMADREGRRGPTGGPQPGEAPPLRHELVKWESPPESNAALEKLMTEILAYQPDQGWLGELATSLRTQARAGRLRSNLERIVAVLEQEKKRMQALVEINRLGGQLSQAGLAADVEGKRIALERLKLEHEGQRIAVEMSELLGLKEVQVKERRLREKEIELQTARAERELEELRRKPAPPPPKAEEPPEEFAARRADLLIKYAAEVKRIRDAVDDPDLAEDLVDRFLVDIGQRERR